MLAVLTGLMVVAGVVLAALAVDAGRRRGTPAGVSLALMMLAGAWWALAYALELMAVDLGTKSLWGDLKYIGIGTLAPAWLCFVLQYTGRGHLVTSRLVMALAVEPLAVMALLANPATHDLIRYYPPSAAGVDLPVVASGPLFWVHLAYANGILLFASGLFVVSVVRVSPLGRRLSAALVGAALLPWVLNGLYNFGVGPFAVIDLTPFAFIATGGVLVWGLFRERMVNLSPVARGVVVETMADPVVVLNSFRRIVDLNPAAVQLTGRARTDVLGRRLVDVLPRHPALNAQLTRAMAENASSVEVSVPVEGQLRYFDARRQPLHDRAGTPAGELVVLRDITERKSAETQLRHVLAERTRIANALGASLLPATMPTIEGVTVASRYHPAGDGREIGGDFYDLFRLGPDCWGVVLGDVSGKGAEAAAVTALVRYTLRTLATEADAPVEVLWALNAALLRQSTDERYCTLAYAVLRRSAQGWRLSICLGGHHQPLLLRAHSGVYRVGRLGTALGLVPDPDLHQVDVDLRTGDVLTLFTDGLVEARRGAELFGEEGAAAVLRDKRGRAPDEVAAALEDSARLFAGQQLTDDLALLVLGVD